MGNLTAVQVKNAKPGDRLVDGDGLRLDCDLRGSRSWMFRFRSPDTGKERYMGLGSLKDVTLAQARQAAQDARRLVLQKLDPIDQRKAGRVAAKVEAARGVTFAEYADGYVASHMPGWKNDKHKQQWGNSLKAYANPIIGAVPVADIDTAAVMRVLRPIWLAKPETASRVRGRIEAILAAAKAEGLRSGENPAVWKENIALLLPSKKKVRRVVHHPALPYALLPTFYKSLRADQSDSSLLLQFIILTAARYNEGAFAVWDEIDTERRVWTIPGARMKGDRPDMPHVVPLSDAAVLVLACAKERTGGEGLIFPGMRRNRPLSDVALAKAVSRHTSVKATTHGFRSTFRDWAGDMTNHSRETCEQALAHLISNEVEAAYRRSDALEKRRALMTEWADYATTPN